MATFNLFSLLQPTDKIKLTFFKNLAMPMPNWSVDKSGQVFFNTEAMRGFFVVVVYDHYYNLPLNSGLVKGTFS